MTARADDRPSTARPRTGNQYCLVPASSFEFANDHGLPMQALCGEWIQPDVLVEAAAAAEGTTPNCSRCEAVVAAWVATEMEPPH